MREIAVRNYMLAFSNKKHTGCTKKRYSVFASEKFKNHFSDFVAKYPHESKITS